MIYTHFSKTKNTVADALILEFGSQTGMDFYTTPFRDNLVTISVDYDETVFTQDNISTTISGFVRGYFAALCDVRQVIDKL